MDLEALLQPIPGRDPGGIDLRPTPLYLQIREARREEEEVEQGVWKHDFKKADYPQVVKLATEALKNKGKELQVVAWLAEALVHLEGFPGLTRGLDLTTGLLERFWDDVFPRPDEDGDLEFRATPLQWIGSQLDPVLRKVPLTSAGYAWYDYHVARSIPSEGEAERDATKRAIRQEALAQQKPTAEIIDDACSATPHDFYSTRLAEINDAQAAINRIAELCDQRFGDVAPSFAPLRSTLDELTQTIRVFRAKSGSPVSGPATPQSVAAPVTTPAYSEPSPSAFKPFDDWGDPSPLIETRTEPNQDAEPEPVSHSDTQPFFSAPEPYPAAAFSHVSSDDPIATLASIAANMRSADPFNPAPYLLLRGLRWGELYATPDLDVALLASPPSDIRVTLRKLFVQRDWGSLLDECESAAALPCGRAWLDLQRYSIEAARHLGFVQVAAAILAHWKTVLERFPALPTMSLDDDTPAASQETQRFLRDEGLTIAEPLVPATDSLTEARKAAASGDFARAFQLLSRGHAGSSRDLFLARLSLAKLCIGTPYENAARPVARALQEDLERRELSDWESGEFLAQPLVLLHQLTRFDDDERERLLTSISRLDPVVALSLESR